MRALDSEHATFGSGLDSLAAKPANVKHDVDALCNIKRQERTTYFWMVMSCTFLLSQSDPSFLHHSASTLVYSSPVQSTLGGSILNLYNRSIRPSVHSSILYSSPSITAQHMLVFMYVNLSVSHAITEIIRISMVQAQANQLILYHNSTQIAGLPNTARLGPPSGLGVKVALSPAVPKKAKCWVTSHPRAFPKNKLVCSQYCYCYW